MPIAVSYMATRADMARVWLALLLAIATIVLFGWYDRYERSGDDLIAGFSDPGWQERGTGEIERQPDAARLSNDDASTTLAIDYVLPRPVESGRLRLQVEVRYRDVIRGDGRYADARLFLVQRDDAGRNLWHHPHNLLNASGTRDWQALNGVFALGRTTTSLRLTVSLSRSTGTLWLRGLRLYPVTETIEGTVARVVLLAAWAAYLVWVVGGLLRRSGSGWPARACVALIVIILAGAMLPNATKGLLSDGLDQLRQAVSAEPPSSASSAARSTAPAQASMIDGGGLGWSRLHEAGHLVLFGMLAAALLALPGAGGVRRRVLLVLAFAAITEVLQLLSLDRDATVVDFLVDAAGIAVALLLVLAWRRWRGREATKSAG